jgi:protocatechuate 3,4-dioxygenase beta subunit
MYTVQRMILTLFILVIIALPSLKSHPSAAPPEIQPGDCRPTPPDTLGPFYKPDAPIRSRVGEGYILSGIVRSSADCSPVEGARIEFWLVGADGQYDDDHRAIVISDKSGSYLFESNVPPPYFGRPPHVHIRVTAGGYLDLITQHYPLAGRTQAMLDLILVPAH